MKSQRTTRVFRTKRDDTGEGLTTGVTLVNRDVHFDLGTPGDEPSARKDSVTR